MLFEIKIIRRDQRGDFIKAFGTDQNRTEHGLLRFDGDRHFPDKLLVHAVLLFIRDDQVDFALDLTAVKFDRDLVFSVCAQGIGQHKFALIERYAALRLERVCDMLRRDAAVETAVRAGRPLLF